MSEIKQVIKFKDTDMLHRALGPSQKNLHIIAKATKVRCRLQSRKLTLVASHPKDMQEAQRMLDYLLKRSKVGKATEPHVVRFMARKGPPATASYGSIQARTPGQKEYLKALRSNDLVFGFGPAGTGKTFLAVAEAVRAYQDREVARIILTRPAVEAGGEHLGFLPGTAEEKVHPFLRPLLDSLEKLLGKGRLGTMMHHGDIEIAPLAFMRGRTLEKAYVLLDEAQNCSFEQLLMLLTRLGPGSKAALTGDATQVDLERRESGLIKMADTIQHLDGVAVHELAAVDVVRHRLVADIIVAVGEKFGQETLRRVG